MSLGLLRGISFSAIPYTNAAELITRRICKPLQIRRVIVVGYQDNALRQGNKMLAPMFTQVTANDKLTIDEMKVTGYPKFSEDEPDDTGSSKEVTIMVLDAYGSTAKEKDDATKTRVYSFYDDADTWDEGDGPGAGWYRNSVSAANKVSGIVFDKGDGLWIQGKNGRGIVMSGQVETNQVVVPLRQGNTPTGNPYPVVNTIANFWVTGYPEFSEDEPDDTGSSKEVTVMVLDAYGAAAKEKNDDTKTRVYSFYDDADTWDEGDGPGAGWYRNSVSAANKVLDAQFDAGEGLWVQGKNGRNLVIKCPDL